MNILISNDDGILAPGLRALANTLARDTHHHLTVVSPDRERSATGHALTLHKPLRLDPVKEGFASTISAWACSGTPSDCIKLGLDALLPQPPDWVLSGINRGSNLGTDVLYSGTVSAAMEGLLEGIPSIAVSLASFTATDFQPAADFIVSLLQKLERDPLPQAALLNINVPPLTSQEILGVVVAPLGIRKYTDIFEQRTDPRGRSYYWLAGEVITENIDPLSDLQAIQERYITLTPLQFNLTDYQTLPQLQQWGLPRYGGVVPQQDS